MYHLCGHLFIKGEIYLFIWLNFYERIAACQGILSNKRWKKARHWSRWGSCWIWHPPLLLFLVIVPHPSEWWQKQRMGILFKSEKIWAWGNNLDAPWTEWRTIPGGETWWLDCWQLHAIYLEWTSEAKFEMSMSPQAVYMRTWFIAFDKKIKHSLDLHEEKTTKFNSTENGLLIKPDVVLLYQTLYCISIGVWKYCWKIN